MKKIALILVAVLTLASCTKKPIQQPVTPITPVITQHLIEFDYNIQSPIIPTGNYGLLKYNTRQETMYNFTFTNQPYVLQVDASTYDTFYFSPLIFQNTTSVINYTLTIKEDGVVKLVSPSNTNVTTLVTYEVL